MFWNFCVGWLYDVSIRTMRSMTSWYLISHVYETRKFVMFVMAILHWKQGLLCDKMLSDWKKKSTLYHTFPALRERHFKNNVEKRENVRKQHFLPFSHDATATYTTKNKSQYLCILLIVCMLSMLTCLTRWRQNMISSSWEILRSAVQPPFCVLRYSHLLLVLSCESQDNTRRRRLYRRKLVNLIIIKGLKTLVWHLSREPMKESSSLKKINKQ